MNKKLNKFSYKLLCLCLTLALLVAAIPFGFGTVAEGAVPNEGTDYIVGETVLDTDFDEFAAGGMPEGFVNSIGWVHPNGIVPYSSIVDREGDKVLDFGSTDGDYYVFTDKLPVRNYIYEVELTVTNDYNTLGICTNTYGKDEATLVRGGKGLVANLKGATFSDGAISFPEGESALTNGTTATFKVISFEGYNHYYMNDKFITSIAETKQSDAYGYERVGLYTYGSRFDINSMKVTSIYTPLEYEPEGFKEGIDFTLGEELVPDWNTNYTAFDPNGWWGGKDPSVTANADGSLSLSCGQDAILGYGLIEVPDYVMEATLTHTGGAGVAFINNIDGSHSLTDYDVGTGTVNIGSAMLSTVYPTSWTSISDDKSIAYKDKNGNNDEYYPESLPSSYTRPAKGDTYTIKLICLDGKNYFYFNDIPVLTCDITKYRAGNTYVGLYVCNSGFTLHDFSVKAIEPTPSFDKNVVSEGVIIDEDFSSYEDGAFPEGWDKATDKYANFLWKSNGTNDNYTAQVKSSGSDKFLEISASTGAHILTLPDLGTENYVFSAEVGFEEFGNAFGLATNIQTDNENAKMATINALYGCDIDAAVGGTQDWTYDLPVISSYVRGGTGQSDPKATDPQLDYYLPNAVINSATTTGGAEVLRDDYRVGKVAYGRRFTMTVYHLSGVSHFFIDGVYVSSTPDQCKEEATKAGFYICTANQVRRIYSVRVEALTDMDHFGDNLSINTPVVDEDFSNVTEGALPEGWTLHTGSWVWVGANGTAKVTTVGDKKGLKVTAPSGTAALILPDFGLSDYVIEAKGTLLNNQGALGLLANIGAPLESSTGATHMLTYVGDSYATETEDLYHYNRGGSPVNNIYNKLSDYGMSHFTQGTEFTLKAYVIDGETYFFINDKFISKNVDGYNNDTSLAGIYSVNADILFDSITLAKISRKGVTDAIAVDNIALGYADLLGNSENSGAAGLSFDISLDKTSDIYTENADTLEAGFLAYFGDNAEMPALVDGYAGAMEFIIDGFADNGDSLTFSFDLIGLGSRIDKYLTLRPFVKLGEDYYYAAPVMAGAANEANKLYGNMQTSDELKARLDKVFAESDIFLGQNAKKVTFTVLSDLHYNEGQYMSTIADLESIFDRANETNSSFVLSAGDFCNNFKASPELMNAWLNNEYDLPAYNVYGNHELESGNSMDYVTTVLTNDENVVWGTADGKIGDGSIAYYHADRDGFRIVGIDTNYYWDPTAQAWYHNPTNSYGPPSGISTYNCLGPTQLEWLESVLLEAAREGIPCIVVSHDSFAGKFGSTSPDAQAVRDIYAKANAIRRGTVLMSINGHIHTNHQAIVDGVFYLDMNTVRNCEWKGTTEQHYSDEHTFKKEIYDANGNLLRIEDAKLSSLSMGMNTWFAADPLSAVVTIDQYGNITIDGTESTWIYDIVPTGTANGVEPRVLSGTWKLDY